MKQNFRIVKPKDGLVIKQEILAEVCIEGNSDIDCWDKAREYAIKNCPGFVTIYGYYPKDWKPDAENSLKKA